MSTQKCHRHFSPSPLLTLSGNGIEPCQTMPLNCHACLKQSSRNVRHIRTKTPALLSLQTQPISTFLDTQNIPEPWQVATHVRSYKDIQRGRSLLYSVLSLLGSCLVLDRHPPPPPQGMVCNGFTASPNPENRSLSTFGTNKLRTRLELFLLLEV